MTQLAQDRLFCGRASATRRLTDPRDSEGLAAWTSSRIRASADRRWQRVHKLPRESAPLCCCGVSSYSELSSECTRPSAARASRSQRRLPPWLERRWAHLPPIAPSYGTGLRSEHIRAPVALVAGRVIAVIRVLIGPR